MIVILRQKFNPLFLIFFLIIIMPTNHAYGQWRSKELNSSPISFSDGVYNFKLKINAKCNTNKHTDGLNDCMRNSLRSELTEQGKGWPVGSKIIYEWNIFVPKSFNFESSNLMVGQLHIGKSLTEGFRLNSLEGYTYSNAICFGPDRFGEWNKVRLKLLLSDEELTFQERKEKKGKGIFEIWCNETLIYESNGRSNVPKSSFTKFQIGLYLYRYSSVSKPKNDLEVRIQNLSIKKW